MIPRVFFPIQSGQYNTQRATEYGERVFLIKTDDMSPFNTEVYGKIYRKELAQQQFNPDEDFIVLTGPLNFVALLFGIALARYRTVKTLMFDARTSAYIERIVRAED